MSIHVKIVLESKVLAAAPQVVYTLYEAPVFVLANSNIS